MSYYSREYSRDFDWHFLALGILAIIILLFIRACSGSVAYNNGVCKYCGGHYVFQQAIGHKGLTDYMYICDTCGHMIETAEYYPEAHYDETIEY